MRIQVVRLLAISTLLCARVASAAAESSCAEEQLLVARLQTQVRNLTEDKRAASQALIELDSAESDSNILWGKNQGQKIEDRYRLESSIRELAESCKAEKKNGTACESLLKKKRDLAQLQKWEQKDDSRIESRRSGLKQAQSGKERESMEIELDLRDAQSDLEIAKRNYQECKERDGDSLYGGPAIAKRTKTSSSGGWNSF